METESSRELHRKIREVYITERRKFESRVSGMPSTYGSRHMPKWDGTEDFTPGSARRAISDRYGRTFKPIWPKIAEFAFKNNVDPFVLIQTRFMKQKGPRPPEPTDCMCKLALELCSTELSSVDELNHKLYLFQDVFKMEVENRSRYIQKYGWTTERVIHSVIGDLTLPFNNLYRHYLSSMSGLENLASVFKPGAVLEYLRERQGYVNSSWKQVISQEIVDEANLASF